MRAELPAGKYVVAVSGGVDSMVLLDILSKLPGVELVVAHFDHGIRADSHLDASFVREAAKQYGLIYEEARGQLGLGASEDTARQARYRFLEKVRKKHQAKAIVTAHHQDDLIETAVINLLRGTGARGLISLSDKDKIRRPLLSFTKAQIQAYASNKSLRWREDSTNSQDTYLRNRVRKQVVSKLTSEQRGEILQNIEKVAEIINLTDSIIATLSHHIQTNRKIDRQLFAQLDSQSSGEFLHANFRHLGDINKETIRRLDTAIRTARPGSKTEIIGGQFMRTDKQFAWVEPPAR